MIKLLTHLDSESLAEELNALGPSFEVLSIYAVNQKHFAWVRISQPKAQKKGN